MDIIRPSHQTISDSFLVKQATTDASRGKSFLFDIAEEKPNHVKLTDEQREILSIMIVLQNAGMCHKELECSKCRRTMTTLWLSCESRFAFNCSKCNKNKSPFEKTFLQGRKMELRKFLQLLWMMTSWRQYCQNVIASVCGLDEKTVSQWVIWIREALAVCNKQEVVVLGGEGKRVFIDEVWLECGFVCAKR